MAEKALLLARFYGYEEIVIIVLADNVSALGFYESLSFKKGRHVEKTSKNLCRI